MGDWKATRDEQGFFTKIVEKSKDSSPKSEECIDLESRIGQQEDEASRRQSC